MALGPLGLLAFLMVLAIVSLRRRFHARHTLLARSIAIGLFGMNVRLPWQDELWAFDAILALSAAVVVAGIAYFLRARWFR